MRGEDGSEVRAPFGVRMIVVRLSSGCVPIRTFHAVPRSSALLSRMPSIS